jgi:hypothetical protein
MQNATKLKKKMAAKKIQSLLEEKFHSCVYEVRTGEKTDRAKSSTLTKHGCHPT